MRKWSHEQVTEVLPRSARASPDWLTGDVGYLDDSGAFIHIDRGVDVMPTPRGPVPVAVVNIDPASPAAVGATGKALKRVLREKFWVALQAWGEQRPGLLTHAICLHI